jgi:hypothetical protein
MSHQKILVFGGQIELQACLFYQLEQDGPGIVNPLIAYPFDRSSQLFTLGGYTHDSHLLKDLEDLPLFTTRASPFCLKYITGQDRTLVLNTYDNSPYIYDPE